MDAGYAAVRRWTKKVDLFSYSLVLVPVHLGMHWCLAAVDMDAKSITYFDSMGGNNKVCYDNCMLLITLHCDQDQPASVLRKKICTEHVCFVC